ncbi:MAG: hypothetical protein NWP69_12205, partial [Congregibacter sp.]|nr:hypothetical protein [Congregibacter sp.]
MIKLSQGQVLGKAPVFTLVMRPVQTAVGAINNKARIIRIDPKRMMVRVNLPPPIFDDLEVFASIFGSSEARLQV